MTRRPAARPGLARCALLALALAAVAADVASAHHVGTYTPQDNAVSANFKRIKFSIEARKFDVALRLFESGAVRSDMRALADRLPPGLDGTIHAALRGGDGPRAERGLVVFFAALIRDLALEADRHLADPRASAEARAASGQKFLEAIWRYYNLIDFAVTQYDPKAAVAVRLAFDEAEGYAQGAPPPAGGSVAPDPKRVTARAVAAPSPEKMREPLQRIARTLSALVETSSTALRRDS